MDRRILLGISALAACGAIATGWAAWRPREPTGRWFRTHADDPDLTDADRAEIARLEALGYVGATLPPVADRSGVFAWDRAKADPSPRFLVSGEGTVAREIAPDGTVLREWRASFDAIFPDYPDVAERGATENWRRARLLPDGSIVALWEGLAMARIGPDGAVIWANAGRHHHDLQIVGEEVVSLCREVSLIRAIDPERRVLEDQICWTDLASGEERRRISVYRALLRSAPALLPPREENGDLLHTNGLQVVPDGLLAGEILLSFRRTSVLAALDPATLRVTWHRDGPWRAQHDARAIPDGIRLFDNQGAGGQARALEIGLDGGVRWEWRGPPGEPLTSPTLGAVREMPNGDLLVTESERGQAWEITRDGTVVWAYANPARVGDYVAAIFEMEPAP